MTIKNQSPYQTRSKMISEVKSNSRKYINPLNKALSIFFKEAVSISLKNPAQSQYFFELVRNQQRAASLRTIWESKECRFLPS